MEWIDCGANEVYSDMNDDVKNNTSSLLTYIIYNTDLEADVLVCLLC